MDPQILKKLYSCTIESILTVYITVWYDNSLASNRKALEGSAHHWGQASCHPGPLQPDNLHYPTPLPLCHHPCIVTLINSTYMYSLSQKFT